jgi:tetratricopeptide (TPR) repeat protein
MQTYSKILFGLLMACGGLFLRPANAQASNDGTVCESMQSPSQAIRACSNLLRTRKLPNGTRLNSKLLSNVYWLRCRAYWQSQQLDKAMEDCDEAVRIDPKSGAALLVRGLVFVSRNELQSARADFDRAAVIQPKLAAAYNGQAIVDNAENKYDRAIERLNQAIRLDAKFAAAYENRGIAHLIKGNIDRANSDYEKFKQLDPKSKAKIEFNKGLLVHWLSYLKEIQDDGDHANWAGPPLDTTRASK